MTQKLILTFYSKGNSRFIFVFQHPYLFFKMCEDLRFLLSILSEGRSMAD